MSATMHRPYSLGQDLMKAGWKRDFDHSNGGFLCAPVPDAPSMGSHPGGLLWFGQYTKPDGTVLYQRSCMDRSIKTWITDPMGNTLHDVRHPSILASEDFIRSLNII